VTVGLSLASPLDIAGEGGSQLFSFALRKLLNDNESYSIATMRITLVSSIFVVPETYYTDC
jgi:hypothetical protein